MLFLHVSSRVPTDKYQQLHKEMGAEKFPHMAFLDGDGKLISKFRGKRSVGGFKELGDKVLAYLAAKARGEGDAVAVAETKVLKLDFEQDRYTYEEAQVAVRDFGDLTGEQERQVESTLASLEVLEMRKAAGSDTGAQATAGAKCLEMKESGRIPNDFTAKLAFWHLISTKANSVRDVKTFEEAVANLRKMIGDDSAFKGWLESMEKQLEVLKSGK